MHSPSQRFGWGIAAATALAVIAWLQSLNPSLASEARAIAIVGVLVASGLFLIVALRDDIGPLGLSTIFSATFFLFHFGLLLGLAALGVDADRLGFGFEWVRDTETLSVATLVSLLAFGGLCSGILVGRRSGPRVIRVPLSSWVSSDGSVTVVGAWIATLSVTMWIWLIISGGGAGALFGSYGDYWRIEGRALIGLAYLGVGIGSVLLASTPWTRGHVLPTVFLILFSVLALGIGARGAVLFPLVTVIGIAAKRRHVQFTAKAALISAAIVFVALAGVSAVQVARSDGLWSSPEDLRASPGEAVVELGATLRAVRETVSWRMDGAPLAGGSTYWAPFDRALRTVAGRSIPASEDDRIMNVLVQRRVGPIGYSSAAEAYWNFGLAGSFLVHFLVGLLLGNMDRWQADALRLALAGVITVPLMIQIRNDFTPVPVAISIGLLVVLLTARRQVAARPRRASQRTVKKAAPRRPNSTV